MSETKEVNQSPEQETQSLSELLQIRRDKLSELQAQGKDPFAITTAEQTIHAADIAARFEELENTDCAIAGRMMTRRDMGKANFIDLHDATGRIQVYVRMNDVGEEAFAQFKKWDLGDLIEVKGFIFRTRRGEISVHAKEIRLLSKSCLLYTSRCV